MSWRGIRIRCRKSGHGDGLDDLGRFQVVPQLESGEGLMSSAFKAIGTEQRLMSCMSQVVLVDRNNSDNLQNGLNAVNFCRLHPCIRE